MKGRTSKFKKAIMYISFAGIVTADIPLVFQRKEIPPVAAVLPSSRGTFIVQPGKPVIDTPRFRFNSEGMLEVPLSNGTIEVAFGNESVVVDKRAMKISEIELWRGLGRSIKKGFLIDKAGTKHIFKRQIIPNNFASKETAQIIRYARNDRARSNEHFIPLPFQRIINGCYGWWEKSRIPEGTFYYVSRPIFVKTGVLMFVSKSGKHYNLCNSIIWLEKHRQDDQLNERIFSAVNARPEGE
jgi:hypothetical protein